MDFERLYMNGKINVQKGNSWAMIFFSSSNVYNHQVSARTNSCCSKKAKLFSPQLDRHVLGKGGDKTSKKTTIFLSIYFHRLDNKIA